MLDWFRARSAQRASWRAERLRCRAELLRERWRVVATLPSGEQLTREVRCLGEPFIDYLQRPVMPFMPARAHAMDLAQGWLRDGVWVDNTLLKPVSARIERVAGDLLV